MRSPFPFDRATALLVGVAVMGGAAPSYGQQGESPAAGILSTDGPTQNPGVAGGTGLTATLPDASTLRSTSQPAATAPKLFGRPTSRSSRKPTVSHVQGIIRPTLSSPDLAMAATPPLTGLPDAEPAPVARPLPRAVPARPGTLVDEPYAPLGIRVGNVLLLPAIGESLGYDTNPNRTQANRHGSFVSQTEAELALQSDWSTHQLTGFLRGAYNEYPSNEAASRPEGAGRVGLRLDVTRDSQIDIAARYQIDTQRPDSPDLNARVSTRPIVATEGASLGFTQRFNRLIGTITGTVDRTDYDDVRLASGGILDQGDRNLTQYGLRGRLGYELSPALIPFVEVLADTRDYDRRLDDSGFARSSVGIGGRVGAAFELTRLVKGEIGVGVTSRQYDDPRLKNLVSPLLDAAVTWSVSPITTVKATAQAGIDETTVANSNGVQTVRGTLEVSHELRRYLTVTAGLTASNYDYRGVGITETGFGALLRADYKLTRWLGIRASYNYERLHSTVAGSSYDSNVFLLGMRFTP